MILHYLLKNKILIDDVALEFSEGRESVRMKLAGNYKADNQVIQMGSSEVKSIYQRRDIYQNSNSTENFFFLGYDKNDLLSEIEVHHCDKIKVLDTLFDFNDDLDSIASGLYRYSPISKHSEGEYFFKDLKIVIMDKTQMGGQGSTLGYFYCTSDATHIEDDSATN